MLEEKRESRYYVLEGENPRRMLLYDFDDPGPQDSWLIGQRFHSAPTEPVVVPIQPGYERAELLPYFGTPPVMSNEFFETLKGAGVDNIETYDAVLQSEDGTVQHRGFKAFNIVGLISAADLTRTKFSSNNPERLIDAGIESLAIDPNKPKGLLMFRLAENVGAVIVHDKVRRAIESKPFLHVVFREPSQFISL
ncbi:MAG TPA: hypothetical protein VGQ06_03260 [Gemmatimonadales bacterium]|jgi:hypothetical protein|nr:hypothetical protein [Gemmatimonadales bacterium]